MYFLFWVSFYWFWSEFWRQISFSLCLLANWGLILAHFSVNFGCFGEGFPFKLLEGFWFPKRESWEIWVFSYKERNLCEINTSRILQEFVSEEPSQTSKFSIFKKEIEGFERAFIQKVFLILDSSLAVLKALFRFKPAWGEYSTRSRNFLS